MSVVVINLAFAGPLLAAPVSYAVDFETSRQNPVTDILILEADEQDTVYATIYSLDLPGSGHSIISHEPTHDPLRSLIIGLTIGEDDEGIDKTQLVMFVDSQFAAANQDVKFSEAFPGARHSVTITNLLAAVGGDSTQLDWFTDTFFTGPAAEAVFDTGAAFTVAEFTALSTIGNAVTAGNWVLNTPIEELPGSDPDAHNSLLTVLIDETAADTEHFDIELSPDGDGSFAMDKTVVNNSGVPWTSFILRIGTGLGEDFVQNPSPPAAQFNFQDDNREETGAFPKVDFNPTQIRFNGFLDIGESARFIFFIGTSTNDPHKITVRQTAIDQVFANGFE